MTTCSDLSRILGRFRRLHPQVTVRTRVRMSLALRGMLDCGELDAAIVQAFAYEVRRTDLVMLREGLHWVKSPDLVLPEGGPLSFLSFDGECFYRHWALDIGQDDEALMEAVFECSSAAGVTAAVTVGLGVALLSDRHPRPEMELLDGILPEPPDLAYVIRRARKARNPALDGLIAELTAEISRNGGLALAA